MKFAMLFWLFAFATLEGKEVVDLVILGPNIVTMNASRDIFYDGGIAISEDKIVAVGSRMDIENKYEGKTSQISPNGWIIPGLINTHTHAPMILLRGLGSDQNLIDWLEKSIWPIEKKWAFEPSFIEDGTLLAGWEMVLNGTTTHLNSYFLPNVSAEACKKLGIRSVCAQGIVDFSPFLKGLSADELLSSCESFLANWQDDPLIIPAIAPHSLYLCSPNTIKKSLDLAAKYGVVVTVHAAETLWEKEKIKETYGNTVIRVLEANDCLQPHLLLSHAIWMDEEEIAMLKKHDVKIAHCPQSNMKLASGVAPIPALLLHNVTVGLGTDGPASNNGLDLFQEMDVGAKLQKVFTKDPTVCPAETIFAMATIDAAKSMGLANKIGSLEPGKLADLVLIDAESPLMAPFYEPYAHLVYAIKGHCVDSVYISGKCVLKHRKLTAIDEKVLMHKARHWQKCIQNFRLQESHN